MIMENLFNFFNLEGRVGMYKKLLVILCLGFLISIPSIAVCSIENVYESNSVLIYKLTNDMTDEVSYYLHIFSQSNNDAIIFAMKNGELQSIHLSSDDIFDFHNDRLDPMMRFDDNKPMEICGYKNTYHLLQLSQGKQNYIVQQCKVSKKVRFVTDLFLDKTYNALFILENFSKHYDKLKELSLSNNKPTIKQETEQNKIDDEKPKSKPSKL